MFNNIGRKIQDVVKAVFTMAVIGYVLLGLIVFIILATQEQAAAGMILGLLIAGAGIFVSWLGQLKLYAYGKMAQCCEEQTAMMRNMLAMMQQNGQGNMMPPVAERKCRTCGNLLAGDAKFCAVCGTQHE